MGQRRIGEKYVIDTSTIINLVKLFPRDLIGIIDDVEVLIKDGAIISPQHVLEELKRYDGPNQSVLEWALANASMFKELDEDQITEALKIIQLAPLISDPGNPNEIADPFVISLARSRGLAVIADEARKGNPMRKIPDVCDMLNVPCFNLYEFMREEGWEYKRIKKA